MPKKSRRGKGKRKHRQLGVIHQADVTVNDFANCKPEHAKSGRITKATANSLIKEVKKISGPVCEMNSAILDEGDTAWYDKNLSDFEDDEDNGTLDENHNHTVLSLPNQGM
ncbi:uncharacterized protein LOC102802297, partial [Saccoglossus kowalevskii]|uniref:Uncharacterized protein LOC102802297 n=1 Tax=Saccoglossus kowalevskii TaxID=10224 RepID=A0ABM0N0L2_SACKO